MADELATPAPQPQRALVVDARNSAGAMPDDAIGLADLVGGDRLAIAGISAAHASARHEYLPDRHRRADKLIPVLVSLDPLRELSDQNFDLAPPGRIERGQPAGQRLEKLTDHLHGYMVGWEDAAQAGAS